MYDRLILIDGSVGNGRYAALSASVADQNGDGIADRQNLDANGVLLGVELLSAS